MELGLHVSDFTWPGGPSTIARDLRAVAVAAEDAGFAKLSVMDHVWQIHVVGPPEHEMLEAYTALGYLAAHTSRIELLSWVTAVVYRDPGLLAKAVTTLDVLSEGRAQLGLGAAWYEREHRGLGVPYPSTAERFERLEETLQVCGQMWSDDDGPFDGRHFQLAETVSVPPPVQRSGHLGGPPVMLGGNGERKTLRMVAQYADATNLFGSDGSEITHRLDVLRRHCDDLDRDYDSIQRTAMAGLDPLEDRDAFLARMEQFATAGIELVTVQPPAHPPGLDPATWVGEFLETVGPAVREL